MEKMRVSHLKKTDEEADSDVAVSEITEYFINHFGNSYDIAYL